MATNLSSQSISPKTGYPTYTIRWLAIHALGIPTVWFLGAIAAMQFVDRYTAISIQIELFGIDSRLSVVLLPIVFSIIWNAIHFGKPTIQEVQNLFKR